MDWIPASGLKAQVPNAGRNWTHVVLLPTFQILRAGESHYREETKFPKLAETLSFLLIWAYPASFLQVSETPDYKRNRLSVGVRFFVKLASRSDPIAAGRQCRATAALWGSP